MTDRDSKYAVSDYKRAQVPMIIKLKPTFSLFDALMLKSRLLPHHCPFIRTTRSQCLEIRYLNILCLADNLLFRDFHMINTWIKYFYTDIAICRSLSSPLQCQHLT